MNGCGTTVDDVDMRADKGDGGEIRDDHNNHLNNYVTPPHHLQSAEPILMEQYRKRRIGSRLSSSSDMIEPRCINFDTAAAAATDDTDGELGSQSSSASNCYDEPCCQRIRCSSPVRRHAFDPDWDTFTATKTKTTATAAGSVGNDRRDDTNTTIQLDDYSMTIPPEVYYVGDDNDYDTSDMDLNRKYLDNVTCI